MKGKRIAVFTAALNALLVSAQSPNEVAQRIESFIAEHPYSVEFNYLKLADYVAE